MPKILVKTKFNWADECDFEGFEVWEELDLKKAKQSVKEFFKNHSEFTHSFGTNEEGVFESYKDVMRNVTEQPISDKDTDVLFRIFETGSLGILLSGVLGSMEAADQESDF